MVEEDFTIMPKVAVLLAVFNGTKYIDRQIKSIIAQKNVVVEIFLNVDKSNDNSYDLCNYYSNSFLNIHLLNTSNTNVYGSAAKNFYQIFTLVNFNSFDFVALSDQDDIWKPFKLFKACQFLLKNGYNGYSSNVRPFYKKKLLKLVDKSSPQTKYDYLFEGGGAGNTYVITKEVALKFQNFIIESFDDVKLINHHDWLLYAFTRYHFSKWFIDPSVNVYYRQHSNNELGTNYSITGIFKRVSAVYSGYAINQSRRIASVLKINEPNINKLLKRNLVSGFYQIINCLEMRRSLLGKLAIILVGLISLTKLKN